LISDDLTAASLPPLLAAGRTERASGEIPGAVGQVGGRVTTEGVEFLWDRTL